MNEGSQQRPTTNEIVASHVGASRETPALAADAMLGRLARLLRVLGFDVFYRRDIGDRALKILAIREARIILTRDTEIAKTVLPVRVVLVESDDRVEQLRQVVRELGLPTDGPLFTRCLLCNTPVTNVPREKVEGRVPPYVFATERCFAECPDCRRVYWAGTHVEHATRWLGQVLGKRGAGVGGD